ncbi:YggS family pyridoxal phosphate-dependent enzyme [Marinobacter sp. ANT_B65]|uniref:YggS family pyridoxal phosphate-dependent enzyme n=1 Tax=Marinobacter sp. ANT_B65 TaxID=2039467 RepID=UPI000BBE7834|nr:YggS family pyridoxal phosphate-dependent enzyme [Marinobacter sp. ANT_B65]PCM43138.1 YggS family pyridoxal phosphate-dependent enzyme [Marinobacter sp. ANT_B65]
MSSIADNLGSVTRRIQKATLQAGREPDSVSLLAVSKTRSPDELREAVAAGQRAFGENYLQEALDKIEALSDLGDIDWHFIGPIQSNKTRQIASAFSWVHSVDRLKIARRLSEQRETGLPPLNICLQVNINNEQSKAGCQPEDLPEMVTEISQLPGLTLRGLMAIPDPEQTESALRASFRKLANTLKELRQDYPEAGPLDTLSMGMSGDLEMAVAEGATWVRIGTAVFGTRSRKS